jgi:transcriptional regulator with XRE-family HTH domain
MSELGQRLRAAREDKGLSLEEVAEAIRIPLNYLQALEEGSFDTFSSDLHARGFLRNYALYLGIDPDEAISLYTHEGSPGSHRAKKEKEAPLTPTPVAGHRRRSTLGADALLGLVVIALVGLAAFSVYQRQNQIEPTPTPGPPPTPTVTPMPVFEGTAYTFDVLLRYAEHKLDVRERIDYTNVTSQTLTDLMLNVHPNHSRGTFTLNDIKLDMDGELVQPEIYPLDVTLRVELPRPLPPKEHVALFLDFALNLPKIAPDEQFSGGGLGYSKRSMSLGNWYPVMAPYREDKGWYGLKYFPVGDPYVTEVADYSVTITATQGVIIAGTGQETHTGNHWHYEIEQARSFAFAASDQYQVATTKTGDINIHSYYLPGSQDAGEAVLQTATQAMALFTELYGPYPYADYRVAETEFSGGMEFTGLTFLGSAFYDEYDGSTRTPLIPLAAHEVAHQWFYGLVGNDQLTEPWLDEALAEYSSYLYYEHYLPGDSDWWWFSEVDQWAPTGKIDSLIYEFRDNRQYMDAVYRRGAEFMRALRKAMGDPAFFAFLQEYQRRYAYRLASARDFFVLVQEFTTADLVPLQEEYFRQRILP